MDAASDARAKPDSDAMAIPTSREQEAFAIAVHAALSNDGASPCDLPPSYRVLRLTEENGAVYRLVAEVNKHHQASPSLFWGAYAALESFTADAPSRGVRDIALEAPHPLYDIHTSSEAATVVAKTASRFLLIAGGDRCISRQESSCTGTSDVCGPTGPYRVSDAAHSVIHPFHAVHRLLSEEHPELTFLQLHGNSEPSCPDALISDASGDWSPSGATAALGAALEAHRVGVGRCGLDFPKGHCDLCGGGNVQARASAGSVDACRIGGRHYGRLVHIEQSRKLRALPSPGERGFDLMVDAVRDAFPERPGPSGGSP